MPPKKKSLQLPLAQAVRLKGRWKASTFGLLTVHGSFVNYDNMNGSFCLMRSPSGQIVLGDFHTEVGTVAPDVLSWTNMINGTTETWRRVPMESAPGVIASTPGVASAELCGRGRLAMKNIPALSPPIAASSSSAEVLPSAPTFSSIDIRSYFKVCNEISEETMVPSHHSMTGATEFNDDISLQRAESVDASEAGSEDDDFDTGLDVHKLFRSLLAGGVLPTCAHCCESLRLVQDPSLVSGLACDACRCGCMESGASEARFLACSGGTDDDALRVAIDVCLESPFGGCAYVVCTACAKLPHSERPYREPKSKHVAARKRALDGCIIQRPSNSVW